MAREVRVQATVRVEVELTEGAWGDGCELSQVYKQAREGALQKLGATNIPGLRIIKASVTAVLVPEREP